MTGLAAKVPPEPLTNVSPITQFFEKPAEKSGNLASCFTLVDGALKAD
jgi:hypothetical protein